MEIRNEKKELSCVFTGHRALGEDFCAEKLLDEIKKMLERGVYTYYCGMAMGFDLLAAELLLSLKESYPQMKLVLCIPCAEQTKYFSEDDKLRYHSIKTVANEVILLYDHYFRGCMQARDRYMADRADVMIAYCTKETGGTAYTVRYFKKIRPNGEIIFI